MPNPTLPTIITSPRGEKTRSRDQSPAPAADDLHGPPKRPASTVYTESDTATNSSDEFDWDEDDEATSQQKTPTQLGRARRGSSLWRLFMKLARPVRAIIIGILGVGIFIAPLLVFELRFKSSPARIHVHVWSLWACITWAAGCVTYLVVDGLPRLFIAILVMFGAQVERLKTQIELTMAVSGWLKLALDISWMWIALSILRAVYHPPGSYWIIINRVMQAIFSAGVLLLVEKLFLHYVAIKFHQKALADRLAENRLGLKALDRLSNAEPQSAAKRKSSPYMRHNRGHKSSASASVGFGNTSTNLDLPGNGNSGVASPSPVDGHDHNGKHGRGHGHDGNEKKKNKRSGHLERQRKRRKAMASIIVDQLGGALGGAIGQVALKNSKFNSAFGNLESARQLARKLFAALSEGNVHPPRKYLIVEDFYPYFKTTAEAHAAFAVFDKDGNGDITKREMREAVQRIYRERKALVASLKDVSSAVAKLDAVLLCLALIIMIFICLLIFNRKDTLQSLVPLATIILGFSFIFGHSAQLLFESLIFIFSTHVFDVGDLVMIDDQVLTVREFGLFSTVFRRVDGQEIIAPNALLASSKLVHNLRRSSSMWETTEIMVSYDTPLDVIDTIRARVDQYVQQNSREWSGSNLNIDKMEYQNVIHIIIGMEHRSNWQDWGGRWSRRTAFMKNLKAILEDLDVAYSLPVQPVLVPRGGVPYIPHNQHGGGAASSKSFMDNASSINLAVPNHNPHLGNAGSAWASTPGGLGVGDGGLRRAPTRSLRGGGDRF